MQSTQQVCLCLFPYILLKSKSESRLWMRLLLLLSSASFEIQLRPGSYSVWGAPTARRTRPTAVASSPLDRLPLPSSSPPANDDPFRDDPPQARLIASPIDNPYFSNSNP